MLAQETAVVTEEMHPEGQAAPEVPDPSLDACLVACGQAVTLGQLAAGAAHEINNPLFAILGLLEFLLADAEPGTRTHERLTLIQASGLEIKAVAGAVLGFARDHADAAKRLPLEEAVAASVALFRAASAARDVEVVERRGTGLVLVEASPNRLEQLFLSLLANAQQALPRGGTVVVEVAGEEGWATATVTDTGPGFPADVLPRVFDPCFTTHADRGSAGVGLTLARAIARLYGGDLTAENAPTGGARLRLRLPAVA